MSTTSSEGKGRPTLTVIQGGKVTAPHELEARLAQLHAEARALLAQTAAPSEAGV